MTSMKQVFIVRDDLKMRKGKIGAQCAHAVCAYYRDLRSGYQDPRLENEWFVHHNQRKIVLAVNSENDLREVHQLARDAKLTTFLVTDSGQTEFNGIPTPTVVLIGPDYDERINPIAGKESMFWKDGKLRLY